MFCTPGPCPPERFCPRSSSARSTLPTKTQAGSLPSPGQAEVSPREAFPEHLIYTAGWLAGHDSSCLWESKYANMQPLAPAPIRPSDSWVWGGGIPWCTSDTWAHHMALLTAVTLRSTTVTRAPVRIEYGSVSSVLLIEYGSFRGGAASISFTW